MAVIVGIALILAGIATAVGLGFLVWSRVDGAAFKGLLPLPPRHPTWKHQTAKRLITQFGPHGFRVVGRWGWLVRESQEKAEAYYHVAGFWWRVPLRWSTPGLRVLGLEVLAGVKDP